MSDPRRYVRPGDRLKIAAAQINAVNAMMRPDVGFKSAAGVGLGAPYTWVYARVHVACDRWAVLRIDGIDVVPTEVDDDQATRQFQNMPVLSASSPDLTDPTLTPPGVAVALEPIGPDKVGRVAIAGAVQVKRSELDRLGNCDVLWVDDNWALVVLGSSTVKLCKTSVAWPRNTIATLDIWESGEAPDEQPTFIAEEVNQATIRAYNKFYDVAACVWVLVAKAKNGEWYLIEAGTPDGDESCAPPNIAGHDLTTIEGYNSGKAQALTHDASGCLTWVDIESCA